MTDETIFGTPPADPPSVVEPPKPPQVDLTDHPLVGEGKKYASVAEALKALEHAQTHISKIESENGELRTKVAGATSAEEVLRAVKELQEKGRTSGAEPVDAEALAKLVNSTLEQQLTAREQAQLAKANAAAVTKALAEKYGDKAEEVYKAKAAELGITVARLNQLASESPKAALAYFGTTSGTPAKTQGGVNPLAMPPAPTERPSKSIMGGATTGDMIAEWRRHAIKP